MKLKKKNTPKPQKALKKQKKINVRFSTSDLFPTDLCSEIKQQIGHTRLQRGKSHFPRRSQYSLVDADKDVEHT